MTTSKQWQLAHDAAQRYEDILVASILGPTAAALVDFADLKAGESVTDIGCGTGAAARFAATDVGTSGHVTGVDVNAGMLEVAGSLPPVDGAGIDWLQHDVCQLPFSDAEYDAVLCAQTLQFLPDRPAALAEIHRVLKPGGRLVLSVWCDISINPYFNALVAAVAGHIGPDVAAGLGAAFGLSDHAQIAALLSDAGFSNIRAEVKQLDLNLPAAEAFVPRHISATPMSAGFAAADQDVQQAVISQVAEAMDEYQTTSGMRPPFRTHLVMAYR